MPVSIVTETSGGENSGESFAWSITDESGQEMYRWSETTTHQYLNGVLNWNLLVFYTGAASRFCKCQTIC